MFEKEIYFIYFIKTEESQFILKNTITFSTQIRALIIFSRKLIINDKYLIYLHKTMYLYIFCLKYCCEKEI